MVFLFFLRVAADARAVGLSSQDLDRMADRGSDAVMSVPCAIWSLTDLRYFDQAEHDTKTANLAGHDSVSIPQFRDRCHDGSETWQPTH